MDTPNYVESLAIQRYPDRQGRPARPAARPRAPPRLPDASGPGPSCLSPAKEAGWPPYVPARFPSWRRGAHERPAANTNATRKPERPVTGPPAGPAHKEKGGEPKSSPPLARPAQAEVSFAASFTSTGTDGPIVVDRKSVLRYWPFAAAGLARTSASISAARFFSSAFGSNDAL